MVSTPHVAEATIFLPSAKLKYGGVRISPPDSRTTSKRPARIAGKRILPAADRDSFSSFFVKSFLSFLLLFNFVFPPRTHCHTFSLSCSSERDYDACAPSWCRLSGPNRSLSSAVDSPDEKNSVGVEEISGLQVEVRGPFGNLKQVRVLWTAINFYF